MISVEIRFYFQKYFFKNKSSPGPSKLASLALHPHSKGEEKCETKISIVEKK